MWSEKHISDKTFQITSRYYIIEKILAKLALRTNNVQTWFSFIVNSSKNLAVRMSIKLLTGSKGKNFWQSWTMLAELDRNNFINDRVTVNSRER